MKLCQLILSLALIAAFVPPVLAQEDESPPPPEPSEVIAPPAAPTPTPGPRPTAGPVAPGTLLLSDNFDDPSAGRLPSSSSDPSHYERGYVDGEYVLSKVDPQFDGGAIVGLPGAYSNVSLAFDARIVGDSAGRSIALYCRVQPGSRLSGYVAIVLPAAGSLRLYRYDDGEATPMTDIINAPAMRRGNATNRVELGCAGPTISASVNGTRAVAVGDGSYQQGALLISASANRATAQARLDNLAVTQIAEEAPPAPTGPGPYDGGWTGTTTIGRANSFTVRNNNIVSVTVDYEIVGDSCRFSAAPGGDIYTVSTPSQIDNNTFSVTVTSSGQVTFVGEPQPASGTLTVKMTGRFSSPTSATGDTEISFEVLDHQPACKGVVSGSWTARK